jgi:hypothetical protein
VLWRLFEIAEVLAVSVTELINDEYKPKKKSKEPVQLSLIDFD